MLLIFLHSRLGPRDPQSLDVEYRYVQRDLMASDCSAESCPSVISAVILHPYLETFLLEWDERGGSMSEVILFGDFDSNETEVFYVGSDVNAKKPNYWFVSTEASYAINYNVVRSAFQTITYNSGQLFKSFHQGGQEEMKRRIIKYTTPADGFEDSTDIHNHFLRGLFLKMLANFEEKCEAVFDTTSETNAGGTV